MKTVQLIGLSFIIILIQSLESYGFDCLELQLEPLIEHTFPVTPTSDFELRDQLPQTEVKKGLWRSCCGDFGPCPLPFPKVVYPSLAAQQNWPRLRVIVAAKKYIGLKYQHFHIPEMGGLDCSNFTSWVYNYALGIRISSNVETQSKTAGHLVDSNEALKPGDLIFLWAEDRNRISHSLIYIDSETVIDSTGPGVELRRFQGKYKTRFAWARRLIN
ncbi:MAG: NlpC/P60 family protein [Bdellovibrionales bacterium]